MLPPRLRNMVVVAAEENVEPRLGSCCGPLTSFVIMAATISKGTLNLRFMQNAQRAEQDLDANSSEPVIKDESHWEVSSEVKEMWGITSEPSSSRYAGRCALIEKSTISVP
jgi:hypothetical protein